MEPAINSNGAFSTFWMKCARNGCETYVDTYIPLDFQAEIHRDPRRYVGIFGGYGSGKTTTGLKDDEKHFLTTPNGTTVVGSAVLSQIEQTYEKDFLNDMPVEFIQDRNKTKKIYTLGNGHQLLIKSFYEEGLLRSLNVTRFHMVEGSEMDYSIFTQLQTRLRNAAGTIPVLDEDGNYVYDPETDSFKVEVDWRRGFVESNPDSGWIRANFLLNSGHIKVHGDNEQNYYIDDPNPDMSSHIIPTKSNKYLPPNFYNEMARNKPMWWIKRYLQGSFDYAEGMVYPEVHKAFVAPFKIPRDWKRLVAMDYGIRDDTAIIFGAIDSKNGILYIYHEIYVNNVNYKEIARQYKEFCKDPDNMPLGSMLKLPVMDGRSINKRNDRDLVTIGELFLEEGIYFEAAQMDLSSRIFKVNTLIESGQLKIFTSCTNLCREIKDYKFPERSLDAKLRNNDEKPEDKKNHAINAMEFLVMEAPHDLKSTSMMAYHQSGEPIQAFRAQKETQLKNVYSPFEQLPSYDSRDDQGDFGGLFNGGDFAW